MSKKAQKDVSYLGIEEFLHAVLEVYHFCLVIRHHLPGTKITKTVKKLMQLGADSTCCKLAIFWA